MLLSERVMKIPSEFPSKWSGHLRNLCCQACGEEASRRQQVGAPLQHGPDSDYFQLIWSFPEIGLRLVIIHFERWDFPGQKPFIFSGYPPLMETPIISCFCTCGHCRNICDLEVNPGAVMGDFGCHFTHRFLREGPWIFDLGALK